jgi:hypothetical protein
MSAYKIQSKQTKYYLFSDGTEKPGEEVKTIPADEVKDHKSIVRTSFMIVSYHG